MDNTASSLPTEEASLAVITVCFKLEQVHPMPPSLTGIALIIKRHQAEKKDVRKCPRAVFSTRQMPP